MPRRSRITIPGIPLHVIQRGNNRSACFHAESDYRLYLALLRELCDLYECSVHAYVLMTNHVHLLVTPERSDGMSCVMKRLGQRYVQYVNRRYPRTGSLWEGRFRSSMIDSHEYGLTCQRYIELNPVRAGMVAHPGDYPWSSYRANAWGEPSDLVVPGPEFLSLGEDDRQRREHYCALFEMTLTAGELDALREAANGSFALGTPAFIDRLESRFHRRLVRGKPGRPAKQREA
jgi:putative transposase